MGYTHSWARAPHLDPERFKTWSAACKAIVAEADGKPMPTAGVAWDLFGPIPVKIKGPEGTGKPTFSSTRVAFNGDAESTDYYTPNEDEKKYYLEDLSHESFSVNRDEPIPDIQRQFETRPSTRTAESCKTARKPYDYVVVACLQAAQEIFGPRSFEWGSDGTPPEHAAGIALWEQVKTQHGFAKLIRSRGHPLVTIVPKDKAEGSVAGLAVAGAAVVGIVALARLTGRRLP